jgi:hypothetical protein
LERKILRGKTIVLDAAFLLKKGAEITRQTPYGLLSGGIFLKQDGKW